MGLHFTIFTATHNRRDLIRRTYASLCTQTFRDFEWLVVDDGSSDGTPELLRHWGTEAPFPIRCLVQSNQGKHRSYNRALSEARGELLAVLDDDDSLVPHALERLWFHWNSIPESDRPRYSGVTCLCMDRPGNPIGRPFPDDVLDCRNFEAESRFGATGEKWGFHRTEILRRFPFPEIDGEFYCPEALVWNRIARHYLVRHVNEALRVFDMQPNGITASIRPVLMASPRCARLFYRECLELDVPRWWKCKRAVNYIRYSAHAGVAVGEAVRACGAPALAAAMAPVGYALYWSDEWRKRS